MEPACANFARTRVPISVNPCNGVCYPRVSPAIATWPSASSSSFPAIASHVCCTHTSDGPNSRLVSHWLDIGWHERGRKATPPTMNVGCSSRSVLENLDGHWFRDQPRIGSTHSPSFGTASPASTSGDFHGWGGTKKTTSTKNKKKLRMCRCGSEDLNPEDATPTDDRISRATPGGSPSDQTAARAGTLESELFLYTGRMRALENFRDEVAKPDEEINLIRAAAFVAQHLYPRITADEVEAEMDDIAAALEPLLPPPAERYTMRMINSVNKYLYNELGFKGATNYLDPDNSCINMVLKRREGLPLTMSLVYMELAKRVGLPMQGVNLPAHFMCRPTGDGLEFFIDAHANGKITFLQDAEERLSVVYGLPVEINPEFLKHTDITNRAFLLRLLFNLKRIYFERKDPVSTLCIIDYLKIVRPGVIEETRDYGICLYLLNRFSEAIPCLEAYIQESPRATDAESMRSLLTKMRRDKMS